MQALLVVTKNPELYARLESILGDEHLIVEWGKGIEQGHLSIWHLPRLLILDVDLLDSVSEDIRKPFLSDLENLALPVILCSPSGRELSPTRLPGGVAVLQHLDDLQDVYDLVSAQMEIARLKSELKSTRNLLANREVELEAYNRSATFIQKSLLPKQFPKSDCFNFAVCFHPCEKVGGDLYHVLQLDERTIMAYLLDISGHGVPSAMVSVAVSQSLSVHTGQIIKPHIDKPPYYRIGCPAEVLGALDTEYPYERFEKFFTICYLLIDLATGELRYSNAGHPPPLMLHRDGGVASLYQGGTIIGMGMDIPFEEGVIQLQKGDRVYLYTDGVTEYQNLRGEMFGFERLQSYLAARRELDLQRSCNELISELRSYGGAESQQDDVTILGLEYLGNPDWS